MTRSDNGCSAPSITANSVTELEHENRLGAEAFYLLVTLRGRYLLHATRAPAELRGTGTSAVLLSAAWARQRSDHSGAWDGPIGRFASRAATRLA